MTKTFKTKPADEVPDFDFKIDDDTFTCYGDVPAGAIMAIAVAAAKGEEGGAESLVAVDSFFAMALHPESLELLRDRMTTKDRSRRVTLDDISGYVEWLTEIYGGEADAPTPTA